MAALTTPFAPAGVRGPTARAMSSRSISQRVPAAGARVQPRKVNVAVRAAEGSIREQAGRRAPLEKNSLFNAKYVPFAGDSSEEYSLDEVIYRSQSGGLLDVQHDMEALAIYPPEYWQPPAALGPAPGGHHRVQNGNGL